MKTFREDGSEVAEGDVVTDFRGDVWSFVRAIRPRQPGYSGKVEVTNGGAFNRQFYDTVFNLEVRED
jgi:hypothetical protein